MTDYKQIIIAFLSTAVLILGLAVWVGYRNGDPNPLTKAAPLEDIQIPLSPESAEDISKA